MTCWCLSTIFWNIRIVRFLVALFTCLLMIRILEDTSNLCTIIFHLFDHTVGGSWAFEQSFIPRLCLAISQITQDKLFDNFQIKSWKMLSDKWKLPLRKTLMIGHIIHKCSRYLFIISIQDLLLTNEMVIDHVTMMFVI